MKFCSIVALALLVALAAGSTARADCAYKPFDFHPEKNDGVVVESIVDSGSSCTHNFAEGPGYKFTGITFVRGWLMISSLADSERGRRLLRHRN